MESKRLCIPFLFGLLSVGNTLPPSHYISYDYLVHESVNRAR